MKNGNEPVNAIEGSYYFTKEDGLQEEKYVNNIGLTKREYFAAMAMQGWISCQHEGFTGDSEGYARRAVEAADALLKELEK